MRITVLGAGYMGSAMAKVAHARGHDVRLWGTWLDDALLEPVENGGQHPRLKLPLAGITLFRSDRLADALRGAEIVIHAVNSEGAIAVMKRSAPHLPDVPILSVTKGFLEASSKTMDRIDLVLSDVAGKKLRFVHASGPAKAMEIARGVLTWMEYAGALDDARTCASALTSGSLQIGVSDDIAGAEVCSALKNAYATGLGIFDGLVSSNGAHNARAACFTQAIVEMRRLVKAAGGRDETVLGAPGIGDLHVTAAGGRNRAFGERIGQGGKPRDVAADMLKTGELTEGYPAIATALRFANERGVSDIPLLKALHAIVWEDAPARETMNRLRLSV